MLASNYVEESKEEPEKLQYGFETSMTATGAISGGIYAIND